MKRAREVLQKGLIYYTLLFFGFVLLLSTGVKREPHRNCVVYDEKNGQVYVTDRVTFQEWENNPHKENYPFHVDPRFINQTPRRSRSSYRNTQNQGNAI